jgi:photosystem II stability/assembly factor-like uncharacterized protein
MMRSSLTTAALALAVFLCASRAVALAPTATPRAKPTPPPTFGALQWRSIGPAISGGRATAVAGTDDDPFLYFVGTAGGGVYRTKDGGAHWDDVWGDEPVGPIGAVSIAPHHREIIWVGTGESNPRNDVSYGDGVYVSTDGGDSWTHRGLMHSAAIARILVDPHDPNVALVAAQGDPFADDRERGVYRTTDGGKTWMQTLYVGPRSGASELAWNADRPGVVFAGIWEYRRTGWSGDSGGAQDGLYRSTDGGKTWIKLSGHGLPSGTLGKVGVAVAPSDPNRVYAIIESHQGLLWRSDDGGDTWHYVTSNTLLDQRPFYYTHLYVDPTNPNHLLAVSVNLAESRDGGKTWKNNARAIHGDHHDIWWAADGRRVINANDGGAAISIDGGSSWEWRNNYASAQTYRVGYDSRIPYDVCVGLQDNGGWCGMSTSATGAIADRDWTNVGGGDATWVLPDPADDRYVWVASGGGNNGGEIGIYDRTTAQYRDVSPYDRDTNAIGTAGLPYRFNWESPLAFSPADPHVAYFGGDVVWKTSDRGSHWAPISPDLTLDDKSHEQVTGGITHDVTGAEVFDTILDIAPSKVDPRVMWVGTDDGLVQLTRDGGKRWSNVTMRGVGPYGRVATIEPSSTSAAAAYAIVDRHYTGDRAPYIFATQDYGKTWRPIVDGLPGDQFVRTVREDPREIDVLYAGLEQSVWISLDRGRKWQPFQLGMPAASVRDLRIQPRENDLIAATHGAAVWILDDLTPIEQLARAKGAGMYLFPLRAAYEVLAEPQGTSSGGPSAFFGDAGPSGGLPISYYVHAGTKGPASIDVVDQGGRVVRRFSGTHQEAGKNVPDVPIDTGINRIVWDLTSDRPTSWFAAPRWNRDAIGSPPVAPGKYDVVLHVGGHSYARPVTVMEDPHAPWSAADATASRQTLVDIVGRMSAVDDMLNALDALDIKLDDRSKRAASNAGLLAMLSAARRGASKVRAELTSSPTNDQDDDFLTDMLRERLQALYFQLSGAQYAPTTAELRELDALGGMQADASSRYRRLIDGDVAALDAALKSAGYQPVR